MTLPNAAKGVKKLFIAEILQLIGVLALIGGAVTLRASVMGYNAGASRSEALGAFTTGGIFAMVGLILPLIAVILSLVGMRQASKDEPDHMGKAFWFGIFALILGVLAGVFQSMRWGGVGFFTGVESILEMCMMVFAILGVSEVTQNIARQDVADMGPKVITISVIAIVASLIVLIFGGVIGEIAAVVSLCCLAVAYIVYLVFLGKASGALSRG